MAEFLQMENNLMEYETRNVFYGKYIYRKSADLLMIPCAFPVFVEVLSRKTFQGKVVKEISR